MREVSRIIVAIDGAEGVGKTSACQALARAVGGTVVPDFSTTVVGRYLADSVLSEPHVFMDSELAQSLIFLADHTIRVDAVRRRPADGMEPAWLERGAASKLVYQAQVLARTMSREQALALLEPLVEALPGADAAVLLIADVETLARRLVGRGERVDVERMAFIAEAQDALVARSPSSVPVIDTTALTAAETADRILTSLRSAHPQMGLRR